MCYGRGATVSDTRAFPLAWSTSACPRPSSCRVAALCVRPRVVEAALRGRWCAEHWGFLVRSAGPPQRPRRPVLEWAPRAPEAGDPTARPVSLRRRSQGFYDDEATATGLGAAVVVKRRRGRRSTRRESRRGGAAGGRSGRRGRRAAPPVVVSAAAAGALERVDVIGSSAPPSASWARADAKGPLPRPEPLTVAGRRLATERGEPPPSG